MCPATAFIGVGSNLGDRLEYCREAFALLQSHDEIRLKAVSALYETVPVDFLGQDRFYNAVFEIETRLSPEALLEYCQEVERGLGKEILRPKGPRTLDLDILFFQDQVCRAPRLTLPHPEIAKRAFVLAPLSELAPDLIHPDFSASIQTLLERLPEAQRKGVKKQLEPGWESEDAPGGLQA